MELLTRTIATALWRCCGSGSGSPSVGRAGWWASTGRPSACRANDPTILAWTTHSVVECAWASRNDHGPGWEESGPLGA